jgi:hypothetical protein
MNMNNYKTGKIAIILGSALILVEAGCIGPGHHGGPPGPPGVIIVPAPGPGPGPGPGPHAGPSAPPQPGPGSGAPASPVQPGPSGPPK